MSRTIERFKPVRPRRKKAPVKRVVLSEEAKQAYEELAQRREESERNYVRHLPSSDNKGGSRS